MTVTSMIKRIGKSILCIKLESQVKKLRKKHNFKVIAVAGSVGKTSTKLAIAHLLGSKSRVRFQDGNYNDRLTVPLIFFDEVEPGIFNIPGWFKLLRRNARALKQEYPYDYVVIELGTDGPGQLRDFHYLQPDISVVTAVAPEHMEYFKTLDAIAKEELSVAGFSKQLVVNTDDVAQQYLEDKQYASYGLDSNANYRLENLSTQDLTAPSANYVTAQNNYQVQLTTLGKQGAKVSLAAITVADLMGFSEEEVKNGLLGIKPVPGRMQVLPGKNNSTIIDDTYNSSPLATKAALDVLYAANTSQRIAILGSMNELGTTSQALHQEVGEYCDPSKLSLVITIGKEANEYLAPVAQAKGCKIMSFDSPYQAGEHVVSILQSGAVVLAKGSQNGVFAEEAIKTLLANDADQQKLVRQSAYWMKVKASQFPR